jgi:3-deoxy-7-phosphoheptulonate synthase
MRVYIEKSRTSTGWKGMLYDPYLDGSHDMHTGLLWTRELLLAIAELGIPIAAEFVDPLAAIYFEDLVTWGFIGARTSASQPHRQFASSLEIPIGFKNSTDGALDDAIHGIAASRAQHTFLSIDPEGRLSMMRSHGNSYTHMVLRGAHDFTNYDAESINYALLRLQRAHLSSRLVIDCSHGNCQREHGKQRDVFHSVLQQLEEGNRAICGLMLESHLTDGYQSLTTDLSCVKYDISITDPCIDWQTTENLIRLAHYSLSSSSPIISVN